MIIYPGNPLSVDTSTSPLLIYEVRDNNPLDLIQEFNNKKKEPTCHEKHQQGASDDLDAQIKLKKSINSCVWLLPPRTTIHTTAAFMISQPDNTEPAAVQPKSTRRGHSHTDASTFLTAPQQCNSTQLLHRWPASVTHQVYVCVYMSLWVITLVVLLPLKASPLKGWKSTGVTQSLYNSTCWYFWPRTNWFSHFGNNSFP